MRLKESQLKKSVLRQLEEETFHNESLEDISMVSESNNLEEVVETSDEKMMIEEVSEKAVEESTPILEESIVEPVSTSEEVVEEPIMEPVPVSEKAVEESIPILEESIVEPVPTSEEVVEESTPTLEEPIVEPVPTSEEVVESPNPLETSVNKQEQVNSSSPLSHTQVINDLVKEVQMFSDDEEFLLPKKKGKVFTVIVVLILLIAIIVAVCFFLSKEDKKKPIESSSNSNPSTPVQYSYTYQDNKIVFLADSEEIASYSCESLECSVYSLGRYQYNRDGVIAIRDGSNIFLYNFLEKKKLTDDFIRLENLLEEDETKAFIASLPTGETGIIDTNGKVVIPFEYENFGYSIGGGDVTDYSYDKKVITASKEGKWGLISLEDGTEILPFQYEDIYYNGLEVVCVRQDGLWYLVDWKGQSILPDGYDMIVPLNSYILVSKNGLFSILNYSGEKKLQQDIPTYVIGFRGRLTSEVPTFKTEIDGTIVTIQIMQSKDDPTLYKTYKFNTVNGELTEVIQ